MLLCLSPLIWKELLQIVLLFFLLQAISSTKKSKLLLIEKEIEIEIAVEIELELDRNRNRDIAS